MKTKLTNDQFGELQRWIEVRDCCQEAAAKLRQATDYANGHNYDVKQAALTSIFIGELENKAISKIKEFVE